MRFPFKDLYTQIGDSKMDKTLLQVFHIKFQHQFVISKRQNWQRNYFKNLFCFGFEGMSVEYNFQIEQF